MNNRRKEGTLTDMVLKFLQRRAGKRYTKEGMARSLRQDSGKISVVVNYLLYRDHSICEGGDVIKNGKITTTYKLNKNEINK
jgi:hypothetical protein